MSLCQMPWHTGTVEAPIAPRPWSAAAQLAQLAQPTTPGGRHLLAFRGLGILRNIDGSTMALQVAELLRRAILAGASEVKLIPGRRIIVALPHGESEVRGEVQTPDRISNLLAQVITPAASKSLQSGWAEWRFPLDGGGTVRVCAELKLGLPHVTMFLDDSGAEIEDIATESEFDHELTHEPEALQSQAKTIPRIPIPVASPPGLATAIIDAPHLAARSAVPIQLPLRTVPPLAPSEQIYGDAMGADSTAEIDALLLAMLERKASDLHLSAGVVPMFRIDGEMVAVAGHDATGPERIQRMLMPIVPPRNRQEFSDCHDSDFAYELPGKARFRVNIFVDLHGMGAVLRVIPSKILTVEDLRLPTELLSLCHLPKGLVLVTGPTGSGKSTTLAALIDYINQNRSAHIITIEDPIEFVHPNKKCLINQRQVGEHTGSFKKALRAALREDPDIVLLGEMRDLETIAIALETAETGHLVFGTLHTSSAPSTIDRIIDQYPPEQQNQIRVMLSNSLRGVICQMLCKKQGGGRVAALEVMLSGPAISNLIRESKVFQIPSIMQTGRKAGMCLMNDNLLKLVKDGVVSAEEAMSKTNDKSGLQTMFVQASISYTAPVG
jgi:twitching motility protein PilT